MAEMRPSKSNAAARAMDQAQILERRDLAAIDDVCARFDLTEAWLKLRPSTPATGP